MLRFVWAMANTQIPGTQYTPLPKPSPAEEPEWMKLSTVCPVPAGAVVMRDVRALVRSLGAAAAFALVPITHAGATAGRSMAALRI